MGTSRLVDPSDKFWNHFFQIVVDWSPKLKQIYEPETNASQPLLDV
jgi:hypothetical protein